MIQMKPEIKELMEGVTRQMSHDEELITEYKTWKNENERINASIISEVRTEAKMEEKKSIILNMHKQNLSLDLISKCTKLPIKEIEKIINSEK